MLGSVHSKDALLRLDGSEQQHTGAEGSHLVCVETKRYNPGRKGWGLGREKHSEENEVLRFFLKKKKK